MKEFFQFAVLGLGVAAIYSLLASGIVLIYRGSGVVNFAHGAIALVGAFVYFQLSEEGVAPLIGVIAATAAGGAVGLAIQNLLMRPLRTAAPLAKVIATLGVLITIQGAADLLYGHRGTVTVEQYLPNDRWDVFGVSVQSNRIVLLGIALAITILLTLAQSRTRLGLAMRAAAENEVAAGTLGWSPNRLGTISWGIGGALAGLAGALMVPITSIVITTFVLLVVPALAAALLGRFNSFLKAFAGAVGIGVGQSLVIRYVDQPGAPEAFPFLVIIVVLVVTGQALPLRSHLTDRLPSVGSGNIRPMPAALAFVGTLALVLFVFDPVWNEAFTSSLSGAVILLSIVVLTGYAGQISLAQFALAGLGAYVAGRLVATTDISFLPAAIIGIAAAVPIGAMFAVPALRTRGVNLAVITLGLGVAVHGLVFSNIDYTGGTMGTNIGERKILGFSLDSVVYPERYAALVLITFTAAAVVVANLRRGAPGRRLIAIRENERAAASLGISVARTKTYAFIVAAALAALGGILMGFRSESIIYTSFEPLLSITAIAFTVIGGLGYVLGPLLGAPLIPGGLGTLGEGLIPGIEDYLVLIGGIAVLIILVTNPDGMVTENIRMMRKWRARIGVDRDGSRVNRLVQHLPRRHRASAPILVPSDTPVEVEPKALVVEGLTVRFGAVTAVDGLSFTVEPGEIVGLIGPNGAGKTTAIDAVTGFVAPASGSVSIGARSLVRMSADARVGAGMARTWQSLELFEDVSVLENILVAAESRRYRWWDGLSSLVRRKRPGLGAAASAAVVEFELEDDLERMPSGLSYGRRRLAAIARSVALQPSVLLLDEPAAGLTSDESQELGHLLSRLAKRWGMGIVLVEHDVDLVMGICDRVVVMNFGKMIASGTPETVQQDQRVIDAYLGSDEVGDADPSARAGVATSHEGPEVQK